MRPWWCRSDETQGVQKFNMEAAEMEMVAVVAVADVIMHCCVLPNSCNYRNRPNPRRLQVHETIIRSRCEEAPLSVRLTASLILRLDKNKTGDRGIQGLVVALGSPPGTASNTRILAVIRMALKESHQTATTWYQFQLLLASIVIFRRLPQVCFPSHIKTKNVNIT